MIEKTLENILAVLQNISNTLQKQPEVAVVTPPVRPKAKRRGAKVEKPIPEVLEPREGATLTVVEPNGIQFPLDNTLHTLEDVRNAIHKFVMLDETKNRAKAIEVIHKMGATSLSMVPPTKYGELINTLGLGEQV